MRINIRGASEHNLRGVDVEFGDGLSVVTGVSGSGKTSLVFDTLYHEARRRFLDIFSTGSSGMRLSPARVRSIAGIGPAVAVGQNLLNRNPSSTLATASGLHPFLRLLYARFGERRCARCGAAVSVFTEDEIVERVVSVSDSGGVVVWAPLLRGVRGSHRTLLQMLAAEFGPEALYIDGQLGYKGPLEPNEAHDLSVCVARFDGPPTLTRAREAVQLAWVLGANAVTVVGKKEVTLSRSSVCGACGAWFGSLEAVHFHTPCPHCAGEGCALCGKTGLHPEAAAVHWEGLCLPDLLALSVDQVRSLFAAADLPFTAERLQGEIVGRLDALHRVGLGYISLDRPSPTLSRGESQRVRLAIILTSRLQDMLHVLDEPTIGQHPADVARLLPAFRDLGGPVVYVEHDRVAAAAADHAVDLGPGAGADGGQVVYCGAPAGLWQSDTLTGRYFSLRERVQQPRLRPKPDRFLTIRGASLHNLHQVDVPIPLGRFVVVTGVSGSGKSTLVQDVLAASLSAGHPTGCLSIDGRPVRPVIVDQSPIGRNPRSNPATYTKLSDIIRDVFSAATGLSPSHFSFNRPEGACPTCKGIGGIEVQMRYLPSTWIPCADCEGRRFSDEVLAARVSFGDERLSIADLYERSIRQVALLLKGCEWLSTRDRRKAVRILRALIDIGLGYLNLGQPSPTLSGGEAQRVKLAKFLGRGSLSERLIILDEPSTGLHPHDVSGLLKVLDRLVRSGATVVVVEHNTDVIRAADWAIDLGPGAGPAGGSVLYAGPPDGLCDIDRSQTGRALREEMLVQPRSPDPAERISASSAPCIAIRGARANNLRNVDVDFVKGALTVVTGVSGSGKSSLVGDILEAEARRRFLESLSLYERQGTREGPEAPVEAVNGLGVAVAIGPERQMRGQRSTVGTVTEIAHHLAVLLAWLGERRCLECNARMRREQEQWVCPDCHTVAPLARPRHFSPRNYAAACPTCHGIGTLRGPNPQKLIVHPEKPLCAGAMYSPGFFPKGYLCKPFNGGYDCLQALAARYGFDPAATPWNKMSPEAQRAFLFGDPEPLEVTYTSRTGRTRTRRDLFPGFYGWIRDWDVGGTYTDTQVCPDCHGARLRPEYAAVQLNGHGLHSLSEMPLSELYEVLRDLQDGWPEIASQQGHPVREIVEPALHTALARLRFLLAVGLGYIHLNRLASTLSAGEAQRIRLAGLLGSGLVHLTVLLDEPSRGLHPCEVDALLAALSDLRNVGNTVIVVEHDPQLIRAADYLIDMGPGAGVLGGEVVAQGTPDQVAQADTVTARWLRGERRLDLGPRRPVTAWMTIRGARANNLKGEDVRLPLGVLCGICGVSGSGKSTLLIDTLGRALAPIKQTTSVAYQDVEPGAHEAIEGAPRRAILVDQAKKGLHSPASFLGLTQLLHALYAESEDAQALGLDEQKLGSRCSACRGSGEIALDMGFLPAVHTFCEVCQGSGYRPEAWQVRVRGVALPEVFAMTIDQVYERFGDLPGLARPLAIARQVGLGYLALRQPGYALSGGEAQRLKIVQELNQRGRREKAGHRDRPLDTLYILDEPTVGQHLEDVARLVTVLHRLVGEAPTNTVLVIEHHPNLLASCDWLIELGPGGGPDGGTVIASGPPEVVARQETPTAVYLRRVLEGGL